MIMEGVRFPDTGSVKAFFSPESKNTEESSQTSGLKYSKTIDIARPESEKMNILEISSMQLSSSESGEIILEEFQPATFLEDFATKNPTNLGLLDTSFPQSPKASTLQNSNIQMSLPIIKKDEFKVPHPVPIKDRKDNDISVSQKEIFLNSDSFRDDSILIQTSGQTKPIINASTTRIINDILRHLYFSETSDNKIDYSLIYEQRPGVILREALHPCLKQIIEMDPGILVELCNDMELSKGSSWYFILIKDRRYHLRS
jgi:hypothetical protein